MLQFDTFQQAFLGINCHIMDNYDYKNDSRIGATVEKVGLSYKIKDMSTFQFNDETIGRLTYEYASMFYTWMLSGGTEAPEIIAKYPSTAKFLEKPKNTELPANFNTFYGPRILAQLPAIKKELQENSNTRRAVISIIDKDDLILLDKKDETLEFPCADSGTFLIRDGKLHLHLHMRSQNMAQVLKLDMYLWGRFACDLAKELGVAVGEFSSSVVSAHIFERDFEYVTQLLNKHYLEF